LVISAYTFVICSLKINQSIKSFRFACSYCLRLPYAKVNSSEVVDDDRKQKHCLKRACLLLLPRSRTHRFGEKSVGRRRQRRCYCCCCCWRSVSRLKRAILLRVQQNGARQGLFVFKVSDVIAATTGLTDLAPRRRLWHCIRDLWPTYTQLLALPVLSVMAARQAKRRLPITAWHIVTSWRRGSLHE